MNSKHVHITALQVAAVCVFFVMLLFMPACDSRSPDPSESKKIDRYSLARRHNVSLTKFDAFAPLSVGNGKFTFTADLTGLQSFPSVYEKGIPLTTMAEWGWHSFANTEKYKLQDTFEQVDTYGRKVPYNIIQKSPAASYLRANPHQTNLAQIGFTLFKADGSKASAEDLKNTHQTLALWEGTLSSKFQLDNKHVEVETLCHPELDMIAVNVKSELLRSDKLRISLKLPYASGVWGTDPSSWEHPDKHTTQIIKIDETGGCVLHQMDDLKYYCNLRLSSKCELKEVSNHNYEITSCGNTDSLQFCILLSKEIIDLSGYDFQTVREQSKKSWGQFWTTAGAIDLSESKDQRWKELERRIILSQYLTRIQSVQKYPPQEAGLTCASWHGKFHLEMHWWHSVHFAMWGRPELFEKSLDWYEYILPAAKDIAQRQGYRGVRWPKMVGPDGHDAPSTIGPLLIWQQPHPIYYAELIYRQKPTKEVLAKYQQVVEETAEFMASYVHWNEQQKCFDLGPPLVSAREFDVKDFARTKNPAFELAYWAWGLEKANQWRERLGLGPKLEWDYIIKNLAPLPVHNGIYVEQETPLVSDGGHPCMLAAYGLLPQTHLLDKQTMRRTLRHVIENWNHESTWGWDYPMIAMTAARLGEPDLAVDALLMDVKKNTYLPNGHNYQQPNLPLYLPGNGGLLTAVAMMAAGWDDCPDKHAPGFPNDKWEVKYEGLKKMP